MTHCRMVISFASLAALALAACHPSMYDPRVFDELADETWVHASSAPDGVGSIDYGFALAGGSPGYEGARFFVAGRTTDGFARVQYAPDGERTTSTLPLAEVNTLEQPNPLPARLVMAADRQSGLVAVGLSNGGSPDAPAHATVAVLDVDDGRALALHELPGPALVASMAAGSTSLVGGGDRHIAVLRGDLLSVIADASDPASPVYTCRHEGDADGSVVVAELVADEPGDEIAVAAGGQVYVVTADLVSDAQATALPGEIGDCFEILLREPLFTIEASAGAELGRQMVTGDFDGNGSADLAISAGNAVHVYFNLYVLGEVPEPVIIHGPEGAGEFGAVLAVGDLDGDGRDELVIGAPGTSVREQAGAGAVYVYGLPDGEVELYTQLHDAQPEVNQRFGRSAAMVPFGNAGSLLVVGAAGEIFAYFRTSLSPDVRQGR